MSVVSVTNMRYDSVFVLVSVLLVVLSVILTKPISIIALSRSYSKVPALMREKSRWTTLN